MWLYYLLGVVTAPLVGPLLKPAFRGIIKGSILLGDEVKKCADSVREEIDDIKAETMAKTQQPVSTHTN